MGPTKQKASGAYYTAPEVAETLLRWALRHEQDRLLDPSCGDGRFIAGHRNSVGIEQDPAAAKAAIERAPWALVHEGDFFSWASNTTEKFDCAAGNPPFIRYQTFSGPARERALSLCAEKGARFTGLTSSWAPFLVAAASLLNHGGRMAFVVPAEIGHAPYSAPLIEYLLANFREVHIVAVREKLFPTLSEDCWLLYADGFGGATDEVRFTPLEVLSSLAPLPSAYSRVTVQEWRSWGCRLRPFLLSPDVRALYTNVLALPKVRRLGELASVGIGYVTGANEFFHLRPSEAAKRKIPRQYLKVTVRNGRALPFNQVTKATVRDWLRKDEAVLLLNLPKKGHLPSSVKRYLDSSHGRAARQAYKCRVREPWYSVPDVRIPEYFMSYMSGSRVSFVKNSADCTCTNSVHGVRLRPGTDPVSLTKAWATPFLQLSCELEGHALGGGMLKLEPREAAQLVIPDTSVLPQLRDESINHAVTSLQRWRHYAAA